MSTSPSKKSSKEAPEGSQPPSRQGRTSKLFSKFDLRFGGSKEKPGEPQSSEVNENPEGPKTYKVSSEGPDGKKVFKVEPKDLKICWKEESQYWSIPEGDGPVELLEVCWLDVSGEMDVTKGKTYEVSFMLSMNTEKSFGWDDLDYPVTVMARIGKEGKYERKEIDLSKLSEEVKEFPLDLKFQPESESDKKSESKEEPLDKKSQPKSKNDKETLYFGLYEVWTNKWKGGLRIHEAIVQEIPAGNNASPSNIPVPTSPEGRK